MADDRKTPKRGGGWPGAGASIAVGTALPMRGYGGYTTGVMAQSGYAGGYSNLSGAQFGGGTDAGAIMNAGAGGAMGAGGGGGGGDAGGGMSAV